MMSSITYMTAQTKDQFNSGMESYIEKTISDPQSVNMWRQKQKKPFFPISPAESEAKEMMRTELKHQYILDNMEAYLKAYFPERDGVMGMSSSDTLICDNGGFEDDFDYYFGYRTVFNAGSNTCTPTWAGNPSVYVPVSMPSFREFEIVGPGIDSMTGLQKVKFGEKALKLNDLYNHNTGAKCNGDNGVNKIEKRFKVTEENRDITIWYSLALENPTNHNNTQPFFSIRCDRAPLFDLCFDAEILDCDSVYFDASCPSVWANNVMDVLDWTCHRIKIPKEMIDSIATLEIVMGDCGQGAHNGYAYIDGICEECTGSALGSMLLSEAELGESQIGIDYLSCEGESARICGRYTAPFVCGEWYLDSLLLPGSLIFNESIDTASQLFCFDYSITNFGSDDEKEVFIGGKFRRESGGGVPVVFSNNILLKKNLFERRAQVNYAISTCYDNETNINISDDYYFVTLYVTGLDNEEFSITRRLLEGYPGESPFRDLGGGLIPAEIQLGQFLIQEGKWELILTAGECVYYEEIVPPPYCSGCTDFHDVLISDIDCDPGAPDTWSFKVQVLGFVGDYRIEWDGGVDPIIGTDDNIVLLDELEINIEEGCIEFTIEKLENGMPLMVPCLSRFTVCPPKPCGNTESCDIEAYIEKIECVSTNPDEYEVLLNTSLDVIGKTLCYFTSKDNTLQGISGAVWLGEFDDDITIYLTVCDDGDGCTVRCDAPECFKIIQVFKPDCSSGHFDRLNFNSEDVEIRNITFNLENNELKVIPNPLHQDELRIISSFENNNIEIYDMTGKLIFKTRFSGYEYRYNMAGISQGMYVLKYSTESGEIKSQTFVKQ